MQITLPASESGSSPAFTFYLSALGLLSRGVLRFCRSLGGAFAQGPMEGLGLYNRDG